MGCQTKGVIVLLSSQLEEVYSHFIEASTRPVALGAILIAIAGDNRVYSEKTSDPLAGCARPIQGEKDRYILFDVSKKPVA